MTTRHRLIPFRILCFVVSKNCSRIKIFQKKYFIPINYLHYHSLNGCCGLTIRRHSNKIFPDIRGQVDLEKLVFHLRNFWCIITLFPQLLITRRTSFIKMQLMLWIGVINFRFIHSFPLRHFLF